MTGKNRPSAQPIIWLFRTGVFVHRSAPDKNLAEVTSEVNQLCLNELKNSIKFESP